jgi:aminopeptidase N
MQTVSRLIDQFIPEYYQLSLSLDRPGRTFSGTVTINGLAATDSDAIIVHAKGLDISSATVDGKAATYKSGSNDELTINSQVTAGKHIVVIGFSGAITDAMHGLYPCYYDHDGVKKELLATQFESHHAREVFPCVDEPAAKATFDVTLTTEKDIIVLGNMPIKRQTTDGDLLVTQFDRTPRMSTYLIAWVAGELQRKTATTKGGVEVNIWATPAQPASHLDFALEQAVGIIEFFNDYFGIDYPLPKSDHVALPDFSAGAMENWGLVTYREVALLADPVTTAITSKQYIALVIAHELSHQWFGNLVTMQWWNNLWLNESFATLMEYIAVDAIHPDWNIWMDFSTMESITALRRDSIDGVQPVQTDVHHPDEISTLFDGAIVYAKGAKLLRMLQQYIGHRAFQTGLAAYFTTHAYGNTTGDDLWEALSKSSGKDVGTFMNTWISQPGYPVVQVTQAGGTLHLHQQQFFIGQHQPSNRLWPVPLNSSVADLPDVLLTRDQDVTFTDQSMLHFNTGDTAHFLTQYDDNLLANLVKNIDSLPSLDRLQLLHEQTLLARSGLTTTASLIPLLQAYKDETDEPVWSIVALAIGELKKFVETDPATEKKLFELAKSLAHDHYQRLGWDQIAGELEADTKLRATVIGMMLYGEDADAIQTAITLYRDNSLDQLNPELRSLIIGAAVRHSDDDTIVPQLLDTYKTSASADLKQDIASGLTDTRDVGVIDTLLSAITDESTVRPQDAVRWFAYLIRNRHGRTPTWTWLRGNWDWVVKTFGSDKSYDYFPQYAASGLITRQHLAEYHDFFDPMLAEPALTRVITMGISEIEARAELIERDSSAVRDQLTQL